MNHKTHRGRAAKKTPMTPSAARRVESAQAKKGEAGKDSFAARAKRAVDRKKAPPPA